MSEGRPSSLRRFLRIFLQTYWRNELPLRAAGISYFLFFSIIPVATAFVSITGLEQALPHLARWLLPDAIHEVEDHLHALAEHAGVVSLAGVAVAMWLLVKITFFFEETLSRIWMTEVKRSLPRTLKKAGLGVLFLAAVTSIGVWVSEVVAIWIFFLGFNKVMPNQKIEWASIVPGSLIGGTIWYATKWGFTAYIDLLAKPDPIYTILGILPLFFLWLHFSVVLLLLSACFNFSWVQFRNPSRGSF